MEETLIFNIQEKRLFDKCDLEINKSYNIINKLTLWGELLMGQIGSLSRGKASGQSFHSLSPQVWHGVACV